MAIEAIKCRMSCCKHNWQSTGAKKRKNRKNLAALVQQQHTSLTRLLKKLAQNYQPSLLASVAHF